MVKVALTVIRHATDNGYVMFFNTSSYDDIHRITADIYEDYGVIYGAKSVNKSTKTIDFAENQNLSYFFVTNQGQLRGFSFRVYKC